MEAVPRMPMLAFQLKISPEPVDFTPALKGYISSFYNEDGSNYTKECTELETLRQNAVQVTQDFVGVSTLKKYYCQLQFLQRRFPMGESDDVAVPFTWEDLCSGKLVTYADIKYEQASILYNIGALHSILGAMDNRQSPDGMKVSCTHFQCAAWSLQTLRDTFSYPNSTDMSHDFLTFQSNLMLAQAQECILEKSMTDNRKSTITAKLAAQIVEYYKQAMKYLESSQQANIISGRQYKVWKKRVEMKSNYHTCVMYLYMGNQSEEQQKWGERLCWYQAALDKLNECIKLAKGEEEDIEEALKFTLDVVGGKYNNAKKDNDFVYHDKVPALDSLPEVKGASLVKGIPFNVTDTEVSGPDIFRRLVPMEAHEASSLYSEEKAKLLRRIGSQVEEKNQELNQYLTSLQIDVSQLEPSPERLPEVLLEKCAAISVNPSAVDDLVSSMQSLANVATDVESNIKEIIDMWKEDEKQDNEFQAVYGKKSGTVIGAEIMKDCAKYQEGLTKASQSNVELHKAMNTHINNLKLLLLPPEELKQALPEVGRDRSPEEQEVVENMKKLLGKVEEMQKQRESLEKQLRDQVHSDDITTSLVVQEGDREDFFRECLKKHESLTQLIEQNLSAQSNILRALTEANANYAPIRKLAQDTIGKREAMVQGLVHSYDVYEDLLSKSQKGVEFYKKLETNVTRLHERTVRLCKQQEEERQMVIQKHKARLAAVAPSRPTAPKPTSASTPSPADTAGLPPTMDPAALAAYAGMDAATLAAMNMPATGSVPDPPKPKAPTLKDYLPYMKPKTFGPKGQVPSQPPPEVPGQMDQYAMYGGTGMGLSQVPAVPSYAGSVPVVTQSPSPVHSVGGTAVSQSAPGAYTAVPQQPQPGMSSASSFLPAAAGYTSQQPQINYGQQPYSQAPQGYVGGPNQPQYPTSAQPTPQQSSVPQVSGPGVVSGLDKLTESAHTISTVHTPIASATEQPQEQNQKPKKLASENVLPPGYAAVDGPDPGEEANAKANSSYRSNPSHRQTAQYPQPVSQPSAQLPPTTQSQQQPQYTHHQQQQYQQQQYQQQQQHQQQYWQHYYAHKQAQQVQPAVSQVQPAVSQVQPAVSQAAAAPAASQHYNQPLTSATTYSSSQVPAHYSQGYGGYQQGYTGTTHQQGTAQNYQQYYQQQPQQNVSQQPAGSYQQTQYQAVQPVSQQHQQQQPQSQNQPQQPTRQAALSTQHNQPTQPVQPPSQGGQYAPTQYSTNYYPTGQYGQSGQQQVAQPQGGTSVPGSAKPAGPPSQYSSPAVPGQNVTGTGSTQQTDGYQQNYDQQGYQYPQSQSQGQGQTGQVAQTQYYQSGQHVSAQQQSYPGYGYGNQGYQQTGTSVAQSGTTNSNTSVSNYSTGQSNAYPQYSVGQTTTSQTGASYTTQQHSSSYSAGTNTTQTSTSYSGTTGTYGQQSGVYQQQQQQQQHYSPSHSSTALSQSSGAYNQSYGTTRTYNQQTGYGQQKPYPASGTSYSSGSSSTGYSQQQQAGYTQQQQTTPLSGTGTQPQQTGQQYTQTAGYSQPRQGTPTHQYGNQQTEYTASYQQGSTGQTQQQQQQQQQYYGQYTQNQNTSQTTGQYQYNQQQQQQYNQQGYNQQPVQGVATTPVNPNLPSPLAPTVTTDKQPPQATQTQQNQPTAAAPTPPPAVTATPPPQPRASSLPPENPPPAAVQNVPSQQNVGSPATQPRRIERQLSNSTTSSLDDILSSSPDVGQISTARKENVLTPKVITAEDIQRQKEEEMKNSLKQHPNKDPYVDADTLGRFVAEVEKFEKGVESLYKHTLSGPTPLEKEWKDLGDNQEKSTRQLSMGIARCYPMKNRSVDIMPYDCNRVIISGKDDYINASHIGDLMPSCPKVITTQCPVPATMIDYWQMVYEQGAEVIVMLAHENETGKQKIHTYWPTEKGKQVTYGPFKLNLQSFKLKQHWVERIIHLAHSEKSQARTVVHLQFLGWPPSGQPESPSHLLQFIAEVHTFYIQQRSLIKPVIVHCSDGIGRTGAFLVIYTGVQEVNLGNPMVDVIQLVKELRAKRKHMIGEKEQLKFCFNTILYHCQDILMKRGILTNRAHFGDKLPSKGEKTHQRKPSEDFIMGTTSNLSVIQSSVAKMHVKVDPDTEEQNVIANGDNSHSTSSVTGTPVHSVTSSTNDEQSAQNVVTSSTERVVTASPQLNRSRSGSNSSGVSQGSSPHVARGSSASPSPKHKGVLSNLPPSLADLQNPNTFNLDQSPPGRRKVTKQNFINKTTSIKDSQEADPNDPLNTLDPLWTVKGSDKKDLK